MWRLGLFALVACKGDAPPSQPPQPPPANTFRIPVMSTTPPALAAMRADAGGTWQRLELRDGGYDVPRADRFTLVVVCAHWNGSYVEVRHWTSGENSDFAIACIGFDGEPLATVQPAFVPGDVVQRITTGGIHEQCTSNVRECRLRDGTHDAIVMHGDRFDTMRARIVRGVHFFDGLRFDANLTESWRPDRRTIEIDSTFRGNNNSVYICLETRRGDRLLCSGQTQWGGFPSHLEQEYIRVPDTARLATDCDVLEVQQTRMCLADAPRTRVAIAQRQVAPMHYDARGLAFTLADADALSVMVRGSQSNAPTWNVIATRRWLGGATTYVLPELGAIAGWRSAWSNLATERLDAALVWGPKPSSNQPRPRVWQWLQPGDRMDTQGATVEIQ